MDMDVIISLILMHDSNKTGLTELNEFLEMIKSLCDGTINNNSNITYKSK